MAVRAPEQINGRTRDQTMHAGKEVVVIDIPSPGVLGGVFSDLILALTHAMSRLGVKVVYSRQFVKTHHPVLVFGLYREFINKTPQIQLPDNYFPFNLSPIMPEASEWFDHYIRCIANHHLIDYSWRNAEQIRQRAPAGKNLHVFDFGYIDLMPFGGFQRSDTCLFYGKLNDDRVRRLRQFQEAGLKLNILQNVWGHERDIQIRTAKAIVNIGKFNPNILEVYRIWHSLCLGTPVYSDAGVDATLVERYSKYVHIVDSLDMNALAAEPISPDIYRQSTDFMESTRALLKFMGIA
ncbi:MAG: hypothetical protein ACKOWC_00285 [Limnohabitans sp.]